MRRIYETCINVDMEIEATHEWRLLWWWEFHLLLHVRQLSLLHFRIYGGGDFLFWGLRSSFWWGLENKPPVSKVKNGPKTSFTKSRKIKLSTAKKCLQNSHCNNLLISSKHLFNCFHSIELRQMKRNLEEIIKMLTRLLSKLLFAVKNFFF